MAKSVGETTSCLRFPGALRLFEEPVNVGQIETALAWDIGLARGQAFMLRTGPSPGTRCASLPCDPRRPVVLRSVRPQSATQAICLCTGRTV